MQPSSLSERPSLPTVLDLESLYADVEEKWLESPCPSELERIPIRIPDVVARFIHESTRKETYLSECNGCSGARSENAPVVVAEGSVCNGADQSPPAKMDEKVTVTGQVESDTKKTRTGTNPPRRENKCWMFASKKESVY